MFNVTEMEATGKNLLYVLDAVRLMPVKKKTSARSNGPSRIHGFFYFPYRLGQ